MNAFQLIKKISNTLDRIYLGSANGGEQIDKDAFLGHLEQNSIDYTENGSGIEISLSNGAFIRTSITQKEADLTFGLNVKSNIISYQTKLTTQITLNHVASRLYTVLKMDWKRQIPDQTIDHMQDPKIKSHYEVLRLGISFLDLNLKIEIKDYGYIVRFERINNIFLQFTENMLSVNIFIAVATEASGDNEWFCYTTPALEGETLNLLTTFAFLDIFTWTSQ